MDDPIPALTPRQLEVLRLVAAGESNGEIGRHLGIAETTAQTHMVRILNKLGARSRSAAAYLLGRYDERRGAE